jgi:hypothetical protein
MSYLLLIPRIAGRKGRAAARRMFLYVVSQSVSFSQSLLRYAALAVSQSDLERDLTGLWYRMYVPVSYHGL